MDGISLGKYEFFQFLCAIVTQEYMPIMTCHTTALSDITEKSCLAVGLNLLSRLQETFPCHCPIA